MKSIYMYGRNYLRERVHVSLLHLPPPPPPLTGLLFLQEKIRYVFQKLFYYYLLFTSWKTAYVFKF